MQWEVAGTQGGTGLPRSIVVNADDAAQARRLGARRGWVVESVHPVDMSKPFVPRAPTTPPTLATTDVAESAAAAVPTVGATPTAAGLAPVPSVAIARVAARAKALERAALAIGLLGGLFVFAGMLIVGWAAAVAPAGGRPGASLLAGLSAGLPVVAAGVLQVVSGLVVHLLADLGRIVGAMRQRPAWAADEQDGDRRERSAPR